MSKPCDASTSDFLWKKPYQTIAVAGGVGFVVGGGLGSQLVRSLLNVGARFAISAVMTSVLNGLQPGSEEVSNER
jgi:hypothetical protein